MQKLELDDIQSIIFYAYGHLPYASYWLLRANDVAQAKAWLDQLSGRITGAADLKNHTGINFCVTRTGLEMLGVPAEAMSTFLKPFQEGMIAPHRSRMMGDIEDSDPKLWQWGNEPQGNDIHFMLMLYAENETRLEDVLKQEQELAERANITIMHQLGTEPLMHTHAKEHFGFRDGVAQPIIEREGMKASNFADNTIKAGEFVFGYLNEYNKYPEAPEVSPQLDGKGMLAPSPFNKQLKDLGKNGTYLVFRQLEQNVPAFWKYMKEASEKLASQGFEDSALHVAAKAVGRWPSGAPLAQYPHADQPSAGTENQFGYAGHDDHGLKCPVGSHIRRSNPRDTFTDDPKKSITFVKKNRIMRRGRGYGKPVAHDLSLEGTMAAAEDGTSRGLHFICVCTNLSRQFELIQQQWVNNPKFLGLYKETDPLIGYQAPIAGESFQDFTIPCEPLRKRLEDVPRFVSVKGGAYFFMPGIKAMQFLAAIK